ncbi:HEAT repeat-containing PBS lyase [Oscillochloris trichoides DG-6]|uniref:HEAT repeat-containing PBS lyase n=1 Tax=Oscillochloris trichoides DG-6 TaxID=765420 RepID=E1IFH9_9CHLR|nr:hypothetical protein [Oscillochloris trichoides]EFO80089.1 HEAT repeat-containing PBS lyase [Oscillochloris trichoides DG-6]
MPIDLALRHCQALRADPAFARWDTSDYIPLQALPVARGVAWATVLNQIDAAPPSQEVVDTLKSTLHRPQAPLIAVLGPAFIGQTSAMRRLAWQLAAPPPQWLPILVDLSRYAAQTSGPRRLVATIAEAAGTYVPELTEVVADLLVRATPTPLRLVIILDGLEAVQLELRADLIRELRQLVSDRRLATQRYILSCRPEAMPSALEEVAQRLLLQYLSGREVLAYVRQRRGSLAQANTRFAQILEAHLLDLAALPPLLADMLRRLEGRYAEGLSRNQLLQDGLESQIAALPAHLKRGDAARQSLIALAWEMSWQPDEALDLQRVFALLNRVRGERNYSLEELYDQLCSVGILHDVDRRHSGFQRPGQRAYCAALALMQHADPMADLEDVLPQCGAAERHERWAAVLVHVVGMAAQPADLLYPIRRSALQSNNGLYMLLLAHTLQALPRGRFEALAPTTRGALLDACAAWADPAREPSAMRRAQIAAALGCLPDPTSVRALLRLATERMRPAVGQRLDYEYTSVRLEAALGLRNLMLFRPPTHPAGAEIWANQDARMLAVLRAWVAAGAGDQASLRQQSGDVTLPIEVRMLALIALADLATTTHDLFFLLRMIVAVSPLANPGDHAALARTAADALILADAPRVATLLAALLRRDPRLATEAVGQLIYLAGRVRLRDPRSVAWLVQQLITQPDPVIKAKALRSLAWIVADTPGDPALGPALLAAAMAIGRGLRSNLNLPAPLAALSLHHLPADDAGWLYLRRTALEALRWLAQGADLSALAAEAPSWPLDLRRALGDKS